MERSNEKIHPLPGSKKSKNQIEFNFQMFELYFFNSGTRCAMTKVPKEIQVTMFLSPTVYAFWKGEKYSPFWPAARQSKKVEISGADPHLQIRGGGGGGRGSSRPSDKRGERRARATRAPQLDPPLNILLFENVTVKKTFAGTDQTTWNRVKLRYFDWPIPVFIRFLEFYNKGWILFCDLKNEFNNDISRVLREHISNLFQAVMFVLPTWWAV